MNEQTKRFTIVVGVDFSELSAEALRVAIRLAQSGNGVVHLVHIVAPITSAAEIPVPFPLDAVEAAARKQLAEVHAKVLAAGVPTTATVEIGSPEQLLPQIALRLRADLIVVSTHGRKGLQRFALGSVAESVTRNAPCSVLTVRPRVLAPEELIEPPCPDCVARGTGSCARHSEHHPRAHTYSEIAEGFGLGSMSLRLPNM
jgi:nucleotide-binding universal stress UspA family protein